LPRPTSSTLLPYPTLFRSAPRHAEGPHSAPRRAHRQGAELALDAERLEYAQRRASKAVRVRGLPVAAHDRLEEAPREVRPREPVGQAGEAVEGDLGAPGNALERRK